MMADSKLLKRIMFEHELNQTELACIIGTSKQYLSQIVRQERNIGSKLNDILRFKFPEYFNYESCDTMDKDDTNVKISYLPYLDIPLKALELISNDNLNEDLVNFDKRLLGDYKVSDYKHLKIVSLSDDSLFPEFVKGDRVIIDSSVMEFYNGGVFLFRYCDSCYLRKIIINPDNVKCVALNKEYDPFYIKNCDDVEIIGRVFSRIRL